MPTNLQKCGHTLITLAAIVAMFLGLVTINSYRFDAQDRLINQRFNAQDVRFNAQDARFDAQDIRFDALNSRFDAQNEMINQRLDAQDKTINLRFETINLLLGAQGERLDRLTDEVSELRKLTIRIGERLSRSEGEIDVIREQLRIADTPSP